MVCVSVIPTPGTFTHYMYMWYYTVYSTALLHVVHDVVAGILGLQPFIYVGYHVDVTIYVYMTLMGLYPFAQIALPPLLPACSHLFLIVSLFVPNCVALCSYPRRLLFPSPFVPVYRCTLFFYFIFKYTSSTFELCEECC